jgi:hypothetical protein
MIFIRGKKKKRIVSAAAQLIAHIKSKTGTQTFPKIF